MVTRREQREKNMDTEDGKDAEKPDAESKTPARAKRTKGANKQDQTGEKAPKGTRASKPKKTEKDKETKEKDAAVEKAPKRRCASKPKETEKDKETKDIEKEEDAAEEKAPKRRRASKPKETEKDKVDKAPKRRRASKPKETEKDNVDKAPTRRRASKPKETEKDKEIEKKNSEPEALENKTSKTWAGRWIPTEANALAKFNAIRHVFDQCLSKRIRSPSSFQPPWFKQCSNAFKYKNLDKGSCKQEDLIAAAELEVEKFLSLDFVRI